MPELYNVQRSLSYLSSSPKQSQARRKLDKVFNHNKDIARTKSAIYNN